MPSSALFSKRFADLIQQAEVVAATKKYEHSDYMSGHYIDSELFLGWTVKALNLVARSCGESSVHHATFFEMSKGAAYTTNYETFKKLRAILVAAQEDYDGGYIVEMSSLIRAEVFSSELDQARGLLAAGYKIPAAVVAGTVLETTLRQMCTKANIPEGKLDKMNADLVKDGAYNTLVQKRITAIAGIRNSAAHGKPDEFKDSDVTDMIAYVEAFVSEHV